MPPLLAVVAIALACAPLSTATTISNTYVPGGPGYYATDSTGTGAAILATTFTPSIPASLTSLTGNWGTFTAGGTFTVSLWNNSGSQPGSQLESWPLSPTGNFADYTLTSVVQSGLSSSEAYWVLFTGTYPSDGRIFWAQYGGAPLGGVWIGSVPGSLGHSFADYPIPALRVEGVEGDGGDGGGGRANAIPEPSAGILLLSGLAGLAALRRRFRRL